MNWVRRKNNSKGRKEEKRREEEKKRREEEKKMGKKREGKRIIHQEGQTRLYGNPTTSRKAGLWILRGMIWRTQEAEKIVTSRFSSLPS